MLEWLKNILGEAYTDEVDAKVSAEIGKNFVSKADFNQVNTAKKKTEDDVKARDQQLEDLKKSTGDAAALQEQITTLQNQNAEAKKTYEAELARVRLDGAVEAALTAAGAKNNIAVKALLADFLKDAKLAIQMAKDADAPSVVAGNIQIFNEIAHAQGLGNQDTSALYKVFSRHYDKLT